MEGNARQVLPMAKALRRLGHKVTTVNSSAWDFGNTSRYPDRKVRVDVDWKDEDATLGRLKQHLDTTRYDLIIPMNDDAAIMMSRHKAELLGYADVAVNDWPVFGIAMDKTRTMEVCMQNGIPCPKTVGDLDTYLKKEKEFKFPLVVKPRTGCGAVGFHVSDDRDDLIRYYKAASAKYGACLIQEYIPQTDLQYKCEVYIDRQGEVKSHVVFAKVRWYPVEGGSSTLNRTVDRPDIVDSCVRLLKAIGWRGYADIDLIQDPRDNTAKIIEINPRITGSVKICFKAGVDFARQIVEDHLQQPVTEMLEYRKDVYLRYLQKDILWFVKSPNRFSSRPSWFSFRDSTDQIFDLSDPLPFLVSCVDALPKLIKDRQKRKTSSK